MILIVDMNFKKNSLAYHEFVLPLVAIVEEFDDFTVKHHLEMGLEVASEYNKVLLSGNALRNNLFHVRKTGFEWIKQCSKPVLGICAGMQAIGLAFGLQLRACQEIGMVDVTTLLSNPLFSSKFRAYALHNCSVDPSEEFAVLAESGLCVQAIKHKQKDIFGVLFHPEVRNTEIIKRFLKT